MEKTPLEELIEQAWANALENTDEAVMKSMTAEELFIDMHYLDSEINRYTEEAASAAIKRFHANGYKF